MAVGLTYVFVAPLMVALGWHINAASAWDRIPLKYKSYSVARNHQNPEKYNDDEYVHDGYASIASLIDEKKLEAKQKQKKGLTLSKEEHLLLADKTEAHEFTLEKTMVSNKYDAHSAPRRFLYDTQSHSKTMQTYMIESLRNTLNINAPIDELPLDSPMLM
jgi:effector protein SdbA